VTQPRQARTGAFSRRQFGHITSSLPTPAEAATRISAQFARRAAPSVRPPRPNGRRRTRFRGPPRRLFRDSSCHGNLFLSCLRFTDRNGRRVHRSDGRRDPTTPSLPRTIFADRYSTNAMSKNLSGGDQIAPNRFDSRQRDLLSKMLSRTITTLIASGKEVSHAQFVGPEPFLFFHSRALALLEHDAETLELSWPKTSSALSTSAAPATH